MKKLLQKYKHAIPLVIYMIVYFLWFGYLEKTVTGHYKIIHMSIDDRIPFCEVFIIPYLMWFFYVSVVVLYLLFTDKKEYIRSCIFLFTGMTIFLIVSTLWPNGHHLRPYTLPRDNIFSNMVLALWKTDTPTNLWPSIHVYNSIGAHLAVSHAKGLEKHPVIRFFSFILCCSIILSTMLIKQHSMFDVLTAFAMATVMYIIVYHFTPLFNHAKSGQKSRKQLG